VLANDVATGIGQRGEWPTWFAGRAVEATPSSSWLGGGGVDFNLPEKRKHLAQPNKNALYRGAEIARGRRPE